MSISIGGGGGGGGSSFGGEARMPDEVSGLLLDNENGYNEEEGQPEEKSEDD